MECFRGRTGGSAFVFSELLLVLLIFDTSLLFGMDEELVVSMEKIDDSKLLDEIVGFDDVDKSPLLPGFFSISASDVEKA